VTEDQLPRILANLEEFEDSTDGNHEHGTTTIGEADG